MFFWYIVMIITVFYGKVFVKQIIWMTLFYTKVLF